MIIRLLLFVAFCFGFARPVAAQYDDSLLVEVGSHYLDGLIKGYGKAEIVDSNGKKFVMFVPVKIDGIFSLLSFCRTEEDLRKFGRPAAIIGVDKVHSITVNGLYQEHMVLAGKRAHLLATRVVDGPVELFYAKIQGNNTNNTMAPSGMPGVVPTIAIGLEGKFWYLRRQGGEIQKVPSLGFKDYITNYFNDYPELAASFTGKGDKLRYDDMVSAVRAYNRHQFRAIATPPAAK
jgi:hypothetical protein